MQYRMGRSKGCRHARLIGAVAIGALSLIGRSDAEPVPECSAISATRGHKIVVGDVKGSTSLRSGILQMRIKAAMNMNTTLGEDADVNIVFCVGRYPQESTFDQRRSDVLNDLGVVVEVWGEVESDGSLLSYAVIPVRIHEFFGPNRTPTGFYRAEYGRRAGDDGAKELQSLFRDARELRAFAALALGVKNRKLAGSSVPRGTKAQYYDNARTFFCKSVALLAEARQYGLRGLSDAEWGALSTFAQNSARETANTALADPDYNGALKLIVERQRLDRC